MNPKPKTPTEPWKPVPYETADVEAIQAIFQGVANEGQQKRGLKWIIERASGTYDQTFFPGAEVGRRNSDFAEGRRFVGNSIVKLLYLPVGRLRDQDNASK